MEPTKPAFSCSSFDWYYNDSTQLGEIQIRIEEDAAPISVCLNEAEAEKFHKTPDAQKLELAQMHFEAYKQRVMARRRNG